MTTSTAPDIRSALSAELLLRHPREAARELDLAHEQATATIAVAPPDVAAPVVAAMAPPAAASVLAALDDEAFVALVSALDFGVAARLLGGLQEERRAERLALLEPALAEELSAILSYPPTQAGSMMDTRFVAYPSGTPVETALGEVRRRAGRARDVFLLDDAGRLQGAVSVEELAVAEPGRTLGELPRLALPSIEATAPVDEVGERLAELQSHSLPVVDFDVRMIGVIRAPELVDAAQRAATLDIQKMVGAGSEERALSSPALAVRKRLPWLYINLITAFVAAAVVGLFEDTIAQFTALAVLLPVVAGQSGNSGAQALAVSMRGLALREFRSSQWRRVAVKEVSVGLVNGVAIAVVTSAGVFVWAQSLGLSVVIGTAMIIAMTIAGLAGTVIPVSLRALGQDPAQSSSIVLTTVTDVVGFMSFLGLATLLSSFL